MKALRVSTSVAEAIAAGKETVFGKPYGVTYRGPLLIVVARGGLAGPSPRGEGICVVDLVRCVEPPAGPDRFVWTVANVRRVEPAVGVAVGMLLFEVGWEEVGGQKSEVSESCAVARGGFPDVGVSVPAVRQAEPEAGGLFG